MEDSKKAWVRPHSEHLTRQICKGTKPYVAVAHSMLVTIYHILKDGVVYEDLGSDFYNHFNRGRKISEYLKKLKELGLEESPVVVA